jgi:hypothetical protein
MFDLRDGSERQSGEILAKAKDWNSAVRTLTTMAGTPAASDFISGVGSVNEDMANALTEVAEVLRKEIRSMDTFDLGNTSPSDEWRLPTDGPGEGFHPAGFWHTLSLARLVESLMSGDGQAGKAGTLPTPEGVRRQATRHPKGEFAKMILDDDVTLDVAIDGAIGRKYRSSDTGTDPVNIHRLLEDPARRVFRRKVRVPSAVILIDQSGSMSLSTEDVWDMIQKAPGATIIGYSHEPGSDTVPNVWVLAHKGRATSTVCGGNGGNGVDGPAVEFAQSLRKRNDPFIWVCDGDVTSKDDGSAVNLTNDAVTLALDYGIHMVYNVDEALRALQCLAKGGRLKTRLTGAMDSHARYLVALSADDDYDPDYVPDYAPDYIPYVAADDDDDDYYEEEDHSDDENPSGWGQDEDEDDDYYEEEDHSDDENPSGWG